jgi:hypothetical protein
MAGIFQLIGRVVTSLFQGGDSELREVYGLLKEVKPPIFRARNNTVLPGLATTIYQLSRALDPLKSIFRYTIAHEDTETAARYMDWLVEARLPRDLHIRRLSFTYKEMKSRLAGVEDVERGFRALASDLQRYEATLEGNAYRGFDEGLTHTIRLANLCRLPFDLLLRRFDARFDGSRTDYRPSFTEALGDEVLDDILDIYFLVSRLQVDEVVARNVHMLAARVLHNKGYDGATFDESLARVRDLLRRQLTPDLLLALIRAIRSDPHHVPRTDSEKQSYLAGFKRRLSAQYERDRDRLRREISRTAIQRDISALFGNVALLNVEGYDEEEASLITHRDFDSFAYVLPMRLLKSFAVAKFENEIKDVIKKLLVDGYFEDRQWQEALSSTLFACDNIMQRIRDFEAEFRHGGRFSVRLIHGFLDHHEKGQTNVAAQLGKLVRAINDEARRVLEEGAALFLRLAGYLRDVLNDYKSKAPRHVSNIRVIGGDINSVFIKRLLDSYNDMRRLVQIMKNFTVVDEKKAAVEGVEQN